MQLLRRVRTALNIGLLVLGLPLLACGEPIVLGGIPPSTFQFVNVVPFKAGKPGGWKAAQVTILLGRLSPRYPETALCDVEVGVPEYTVEGKVATSEAQAAAAAAANEAARLVLRQRLPIATACQKFLDTMRALMTTEGGLAYIPGAKVGKFYFRGLPQRTFP